MINVGPQPQTLPPKKPVGGMVTSHGFDPSVYRSGLSGQQRKDFDSLGKNIKGDYAGWAKNAGFGKDTANAFNKRYKLPQTNMPRIGGPIVSHGPGSGAPPTAGPGSGMPSFTMMNSGNSLTGGGVRPPMGPVQREWQGGFPGSSGSPMNGTAPNMFPGAQSMVGNYGGQPSAPMGNYGGGMNNIVQGPSSMQSPMQAQPDMNSMLGMMGMMSMMNRGGGGMQPQQPQQPQRNRMAGGMVDPNFSRMMAVKAAGGMGSNMARMPGSNAQHGPGAFGVSPELYYQHFDQQGMPKQQQQQPNLWQMYQQMLGGGQQQPQY
jgi:hypothetical protein